MPFEKQGHTSHVKVLSLTALASAAVVALLVGTKNGSASDD